MLTRAFIVLFLLGALACLRTEIHPRAFAENELCAKYVHLGDLERAEVHCDVGLQFSPQYGDLWTNKGIIALSRGQEDVAKACFIKALRYNPEQAQAYQNLGYIYLKNRQYGRAHDNFQRALKVNPDYAEARYNLALAYMGMKKNKNARKELLTLTETYPHLADPWARLGQLELDDNNNVLNAIEYFKQALLLSPQYADVRLELGNAYMQAGMFCEAANAYTLCIEANPSILGCPKNLPLAVEKCALLTPALTTLEETKGSEQTPESQYSLGLAYGEKGLRNHEQRAYERCLRYNNKYAPCYYGLFKIFNDELNATRAKTACQNFLKFTDETEFPKERETCEKYLGDTGFRGPPSHPLKP
ncbi:MAG: tetratricopeptide repeat protein [Proteobacteria bacterium]|nr:tetratricopeptide repeat protein [Cystobacterineae bacterium]MCL2259615.1 tetratricopeptide repeat protein [Cystobacterineae bacterium]MCL2313859.1 tetratricopeptide repeat protein [Pseudomonadota bacterium]